MAEAPNTRKRRLPEPVHWPAALSAHERTFAALLWERWLKWGRPARESYRTLGDSLGHPSRYVRQMISNLIAADVLKSEGRVGNSRNLRDGKAWPSQLLEERAERLGQDTKLGSETPNLDSKVGSQDSSLDPKVRSQDSYPLRSPGSQLSGEVRSPGSSNPYSGDSYLTRSSERARDPEQAQNQTSSASPRSASEAESLTAKCRWAYAAAERHLASLTAPGLWKALACAVADRFTSAQVEAAFKALAEIANKARSPRAFLSSPVARDTLMEQLEQVTQLNGHVQRNGDNFRDGKCIGCPGIGQLCRRNNPSPGGGFLPPFCRPWDAPPDSDKPAWKCALESETING